MSDTPKDNVVNLGDYKTEEVSDAAELVRSISEMEFDDVMVLGLKGDEVYMAHTPFDSRLKLIGALSGMSQWLWAKGG